MTIFTDTFIPYEFKDIKKGMQYVIDRCNGIKKSLKFIELTNEHLMVRCPFVGDYLTITGTVQELTELNKELTRQEWYRVSYKTL